MNETETSIQPTCIACKAALLPNASFCDSCGAAQRPEAKKAPALKGRMMLGRLTEDAHRSQIKTARITIMVVALITLAYAIYQHTSFNENVAKARLDHTLRIDEAIVSSTIMLFYATYFIVAIFFGMFVWAKTNPFAACLTTLIIYISSIAFTGVLAPITIIQGLLMKIIVIVFLINGVKSGLAYRRLKEKSPSA